MLGLTPTSLGLLVIGLGCLIARLYQFEESEKNRKLRGGLPWAQWGTPALAECADVDGWVRVLKMLQVLPTTKVNP